MLENTPCASPVISWLGGSGFVLKYREAILYINPCLPDSSSQITHAGLILCTQRGRLDPDTVPAMLSASPRAKLVIPKSLGGYAHSLGISYDRMVTTDAGLRVEYLDDRIYAVPSANPELDWTPLGGYPHLGYLVRFGAITIYHPGDCVLYEDLAARLKPYKVTVALLPIAGRPNAFEIGEAAQLAEETGARWLAPIHDDPARVERFVEHMLGHRPAQAFKVFRREEMWTVPAI